MSLLKFSTSMVLLERYWMVDRWVVGRMCGKNLNVKDL